MKYLMRNCCRLWQNLVGITNLEVDYGKTNQLLKEKLESNYKVDVITI